MDQKGKMLFSSNSSMSELLSTNLLSVEVREKKL